jgi:pimeloyl-ACP methyl ester carboxylesterase
VTQIWFEGAGRTPAQVGRVMRTLAYAMNRGALALAAKNLDSRLRDADVAAAKPLDAVRTPMLVFVGEHDLPYLLAAADCMAEQVPSAHRVLMRDAAHLANMDHAEEFRRVVGAFLSET